MEIITKAKMWKRPPHFREESYPPKKKGCSTRVNCFVPLHHTVSHPAMNLLIFTEISLSVVRHLERPMVSKLISQ